MTVNFFSAPNAKSLSDRLVRDVLQRASASRTRNRRSHQKTYSPDLNQATEIPASFDDNDLSPPKPTSKTNQPSAHIDSSLSTPTVDIIRLVETRIDDSNEMDLSNVTVAAEAIIRQRRRMQQRKYRKQQREYVENLECDVRKIQEEIKMLEKQLHYASIGISKSQTLWGAATDYFRLFRHGLRSPTDAVYSCALDVLESSMTPNVSDGLVYGPKAVLTRWMLFSLCFDDIYVDLQRLEKGPVENSVVATVITSITISTGSLRLVFPHLIQEGEPDGSVTSLADKLLGKRLVVQGSVVFEWDDTMGRVCKMQSQSDMLSPLLRVLGNLEDVSRVFEGSLVTPECNWPQFLV